jgi:hypothetical protein
MKQRNRFLIILLGVIVFGISGCFPDNSRVYDGPLQVEFRPTSATLSMEEATSYNVPLQLIGPHQSSDINVNFEIDDENSTAIAGEHFELNGLTATIPANSSFGSINIQAIEENIDDSEPVLVITLTSTESSDVRIAQNYKSFELTFTP